MFYTLLVCLYICSTETRRNDSVLMVNCLKTGEIGSSGSKRALGRIGTLLLLNCALNEVYFHYELIDTETLVNQM